MFLTAIMALFFGFGDVKSTWAEPWHEDVIRNSHVLVRGRVIETDGQSMATMRLEKHLAGSDVAPIFKIRGFSMVYYMSWSTGSDARLRMLKGRSYYLLLRWNKRFRAWQVATPSAGCDPIAKEGVHGTFRRSFAKALVDEATFEMAQVALFLKLHGMAVDSVPIRAFIKEWLRKDPVSISSPRDEAESMIFFRQHVALELLRYFSFPGDLKLIEPFVKLAEYHVAMSAVRALAHIEGKEAESRLAKVVTDKGAGAPKNLAVFALRERNALHTRPILEAWIKTGLDQSAELGLPIMDPRIATSAGGSVRREVLRLIKVWDQKP